MMNFQRKLLSGILMILLLVMAHQNEANGQKFEANWTSLANNYKTPDWFRDAKFGIFMHWGIMSAIDENRDYGGSHYGRYMYGPGEFPPDHQRSQWAIDLLKWHTENYGHPNEHGYKDFIPMFKAEKWDPDALVAFYKEAGAKYIVPVAVHHDNFDLYKSIHRWNAYEMGPKKDIIQGWKEAAEKHGLWFGVSSHLDRVSSFFQVSRKYDGGKPEYADFYGSNYNIEHQKDEAWQQVWYARTMQLIDQYQPDLLYFDGSLPGIYGNMDYGFRLAAHFYNSNMEKHDGKLNAVMNLKHGPDKRAFVWDIERGQSDALQRLPWQTDTDLQGGWFYLKKEPNFTAEVLIGNFIDIISKNGNLLLNVGLRGDGTLPENQAAVLKEMGRWLKINGEAVYGSRPWLVYGEGPTKITSGAFNEPNSDYTTEDIRFTTNNGFLYAFILNTPAEEVNIRSLSDLLTLAGEIRSIELLGCSEKLQWERKDNGLKIEIPKTLPSKYALVFKIGLDETSSQMWEMIIE